MCIICNSHGYTNHQKVAAPSWLVGGMVHERLEVSSVASAAWTAEMIERSTLALRGACG